MPKAQYYKKYKKEDRSYGRPYIRKADQGKYMPEINAFAYDLYNPPGHMVSGMYSGDPVFAWKGPDLGLKGTGIAEVKAAANRAWKDKHPTPLWLKDAKAAAKKDWDNQDKILEQGRQLAKFFRDDAAKRDRKRRAQEQQAAIKKKWKAFVEHADAKNMIARRRARYAREIAASEKELADLGYVVEQ